MCPALVDSKEIKEVFLSDSNVKKVVEYGYKSDTILITMGAYGIQNAVHRAGYLSDEEMQALMQKGAVGDICDHIINEKGEICDRDLVHRYGVSNFGRFKKEEKKNWCCNWTE